MTYTPQSLVMSQGQATAPQIQAWFTARGPDYVTYAPDGKYQPPPWDLGAAIVSECHRYAPRIVNHDLVAAQVLHETAAWQSEYARERNNPGGIGAINSDPDQALTFSTVAEGIRAHVAHVLVYCIGDGAWTVDDRRYDAVARAGWVGVVRELEDFEGRWAWPGETYADSIATLANQLIATEVPAMPLIPGLIDIRSQLPRNTSPGHGPNETRPIGDKAGIIIHYRGVVTDPNHQGIGMIQADALYHVSRDWGGGVRGDGLMYHVEIGPNGEKYLCRDLDAVLWHCGSWPENATYWAVSIPIGPGQHATPQQLQAATEVCDALRAVNDIPRANVKGHQEVSSTTCPGTLMDDFVRPYRAGEDQPVHDGALYIAGNPFGDIPIVLGFRDWFLTVGAARNPNDPIAGGLSVIGYPVAAEVATDYGSSQRFERGELRWDRDTNPPFDIVLALLSDVKAA